MGCSPGSLLITMTYYGGCSGTSPLVSMSVSRDFGLSGSLVVSLATAKLIDYGFMGARTPCYLSVSYDVLLIMLVDGSLSELLERFRVPMLTFSMCGFGGEVFTGSRDLSVPTLGPSPLDRLFGFLGALVGSLQRAGVSLNMVWVPFISYGVGSLTSFALFGSLASFSSVGGNF